MSPSPGTPMSPTGPAAHPPPHPRAATIDLGHLLTCYSRRVVRRPHVHVNGSTSTSGLHTYITSLAVHASLVVASARTSFERSGVRNASRGACVSAPRHRSPIPYVPKPFVRVECPVSLPPRLIRHSLQHRTPACAPQQRLRRSLLHACPLLVLKR